LVIQIRNSMAQIMRRFDYGMTALASIGAFSVMHVFLPPHPGPIAASEFYGANIGQVLILGLPTAFITWYFSGYMLGKVLGRTIHVPVPELLSGGTQDNDLPK
ncbi:hypothetical protein LN384_28735, partial [Enterobacter hormaechei subsp. steigerwaltii]|nr:hypothetical protein [Enterobacter hormaechei subsp. steigerwaltii]